MFAKEKLPEPDDEELALEKKILREVGWKVYGTGFLGGLMLGLAAQGGPPFIIFCAYYHLPKRLARLLGSLGPIYEFPIRFIVEVFKKRPDELIEGAIQTKP